MQVVVNGESRQVPEDATLEAVLREFGVPERGVAVALDGAVVPRAAWPATGLRAEATVEVLTAVQGG
ncbi:sulfur carrier protein [Saccharopolyspora erythraea NRRL 2338]|uniref:Thiamine-biosynthesis n=2 Tax=Saccharopolyspora erythraea TaxID=1836 RepID=A4F729_SACEN|nr:sulfur carrier protein ThiS [Saccharopolyspora erythraea]EQD82869.1 thiamine biosynthesis protein ThiS [Saccharopolyspora erythraea D]PFG93655.1 sulfur carrier protein [Saccharopolyspora erythraea NRRL 2338]QRK90505.1 sulfur carrier protein ThiS [Saccharopolyspora erythraea]CAL99853.1 thiamine-biosynthesis [Saccharopolyspora erythraea NRRL 2338]